MGKNLNNTSLNPFAVHLKLNTVCQLYLSLKKWLKKKKPNRYWIEL